MRTKPALGGKAFFVSLLTVLAIILLPAGVLAATQSMNQSVNVTAIVPGPPPSTPAIITSPSDGTNVAVGPIVISGTCQPTLVVKVFNNDILTGTTTCANDGTFTINTTLTNSLNVLSALNYDSLDRAGPASPKVNVYFPSLDNPNVSIPGGTSGGTGRKPGNGNKPSSGTPATPSTPTQPNKDTGIKDALTNSVAVATLLSFWLLSVVLVICLLLLKRRRKRS